MNPYANHLLSQWGLWCLSGRTDLGYPHHTAFLNGQPQTGGRSLGIQDETAMKVQRAVISLDLAHRRTVEFYYVKMRNCRVADVARYLRCSEKTVFNRLHRAQARVMEVVDGLTLESSQAA